ncbi:MAG: hypothetical protein K6U00_06175 [Armatimonadetes bacterium]|nr:hypothetical protein [Armatimonadota bacterium]
MLRIAAASAGLLTVLETIVLYSLLRTDPVSLAASLALFNAVLAVVVGRLSVAQVSSSSIKSLEAQFRVNSYQLSRRVFAKPWNVEF